MDCRSPKKEELKNILLNVQVPFYYSKFEKIVEASKGDYLLGTNYTWADLHIAHTVSFIDKTVKPGLLDDYPKLKKFSETVFNIPKLSGADEWESAQCDELVDAISDLVDEFVKFAIKEQDPVKKEELKKTFVTSTFPTFLMRINKRQMENSSGTCWLVGKTMTWADIVIAEMLRQISEAADPASLNGYPHVRKMFDNVFAQPNIKQYVDAMKK
ncbi:Glutathione S-transferase [Orchesella cincta]|uniref:glutathione transferase n=1 Tax=Orchesella cincta TaxID=48709 RepID=A0A1D2M0H8_ORCCI|nr:Glutathione S-transferase [Orchesella cincta]